MLATMYDAHGIGSGHADRHYERVVVIDVSEERDQPLVLINPGNHPTSLKSRWAMKAAFPCPAFTTA